MESMVLAGLVSGSALVVAGVLKLGRADDLRTTADDLGVPAFLARPWLLRSLPVVEIVLGVLVVVVPAPVVLAPAVLATALLGGYVVLVARVLARGEEVSCACFGSTEPVTATTLARNVLLTLAAVLTVVDAVGGRSTVARLVDLGAPGWGWLVATVAVAAVVLMVVPRGGAGTLPPAVAAPDPADGARGIPFLPVYEPDGTLTSLPELARLRPQLLVHLSETCSHCEKVTDLLPEWRERLPAVDLRVVTGSAPGTAAPASWAAPLHDPAYAVATVLGLGLPSAVLLGADALIAGGPVHGRQQIAELVAEIEDVLAGEDAAQPR